MKIKKILMSICFFGYFIMILLLQLDVELVASTNTKVGLYFINKLFYTGKINEFWDKVADIFLFVGICIILIFIVLGFIQLMKKKKLSLVDKDIILFGINIIFIAFVWILFDKILIINYRPVLVDGELESSFPSTHILIIAFTYLSFARMLFKKFKNPNSKILIYGLVILLIILAVIVRILSGLHWFTDIFAGLLISVGCFLEYDIILNKE